MTEAEWLACDDLEPMLTFLLHGKASDKKLRLFPCACCRRIWHLLHDDRSKKAVEASERYVDGTASLSELLRAYRESTEVRGNAAKSATLAADAASSADYTVASAASAAAWAAVDEEGLVKEIIEKELGSGGEQRSWDAWRQLAKAVVAKEQASIFRDIFGDPFRPTLVKPSWLAWNDGTIRKMAQVIYDARAFDRLPLLADALEDAGCTDADVLNHCRTPGEHVRGCWVVDLLLGKS